MNGSIDSVNIRYFSDNGYELNADALSYQPPYADPDFSEERLSRWLSRNFTIKPYLTSVGMFKWTGSVLVNEVPEPSTLLLKVQVKTKDTVEITYQDTITYGRVQKALYV